MNTAVVFFSLTGNNEKLAKSLAREYKADLIEVKTTGKFTMGTIAFDVIFNRTPKVTPEPKAIEAYDNVIFVGPIWLGQQATPLRSYFKAIKETGKKYSYITVCGGSKGGNKGLDEQLVKKIGRKPEFSLELRTACLVPEESSDSIKDTSDYKLNDEDVKNFTADVVKAIGQPA